MSLETQPIESAKAKVTLWHQLPATCQRIDVTSAVALNCESPYVAELNRDSLLRRRGEVVVAPVAPIAGAIAVLLVRHEPSDAISLNRVPVPAGLYLLKHSDRIELGQQVFWAAVAPKVEEAMYDPAVHGVDVFCYLTKARLRVGQRLKICPGLDGVPCGAIYKAEAWDMAMQSVPSMPCAGCGYHQSTAEWQPPPVQSRTSLAQRFQALLGDKH